MNVTLDDVVGCLIQNADALRKAGVRDLKVGDLSVTLAPPDAPVEVPAEPEPDHSDPLNDPLTFGRATSVPRFDREDP